MTDLQKPLPPIYFSIPLRGKSSSHNWQKVCLILQATLRSVASQSGKGVEVLIACHEKPDLGNLSHLPISFIQTDREKPTSSREQLNDKRHKKMLLAEEICRRGGGYMVLMDSDDLVSNKLVPHMRANHNERGFLLDTGYLYDVRRQRFRMVRNFSEMCGSCAVFYLQPSDLGEATDPKEDEAGWVYQIGDAPHMGFGAMAAKLGRPLDPVEFPAVIYVQNHGENHTMLGQKRGTLDTIKDKIHHIRNVALPSRRIPKHVKAEFSLRPDTY